jgi:predicted PurR-regulated permease PerM
MTLAVSALVLAALYVGREVFLPVVFAVLLGFVIAPFVDLLRRLYIPRVPAVILAVLVALGIVLSLGAIIGSQVAGLVVDLPRYQSTVREKLSSLQEGVLGRLPALVRHVGRELEHATQEPPPAPVPAGQQPRADSPPAQPAAPAEQKPLPVEVHEPEPTPIELARTLLLPVLAPLATVGLTFVVLVFILLQREDLRDRMIRLFGSSDLHRTTAAMDDAARRLSRYFLLQLGLNASFGVVIAIGLWAIGLPSPLLWGIFAALMRFVPYIGSIIAGIVPVALAAAVDPGWSMALMTLLLFLTAEPLMGHVIEPLVYGKSTGLSPFAVVMSAIFWTWLWGPVGLLLATPLTLCLVVLGRHVERFEFLDVLLGDRPALTPAENLYQRMLAGDPDEALQSAELLLKDRSLTSYYDEVALGGLQLAANDASRGVLSGAQLERVKDAVVAVVHDLGGHDDVEPAPKDSDTDPVAPPMSEKPVEAPPVNDVRPPRDAVPEAWKAPRAVACVAGRGPLDDAAAAMLAQLLGKHGLGTEVLPHDAVSRSAILGLDPTGIQMVCLTYVGLTGTPAHLRYLLRRLRQRLPGVAILVGFWPPDDRVLTDEKQRETLPADYFVSSLREAVLSCLEAATKQKDGPEGPKSDVKAPPPEEAREPVKKAPLPA